MLWLRELKSEFFVFYWYIFILQDLDNMTICFLFFAHLKLRLKQAVVNIFVRLSINFLLNRLLLKNNIIDPN